MNAEFGQTKVPFPDGTILVSDQQAALLDGARSRAEAYAILNAHPELFRCDFCSRPGVAVSYDAVDFDTGYAERDGTKHVSRGGWAACQVCADLIEADDREALADRSLGSWVEQHPGSAGRGGQIREALRKVHDEFFRNRQGAGVPGVMPMPGAGLDRLVVTDGRMFVFDGKRRLARRE